MWLDRLATKVKGGKGKDDASTIILYNVHIHTLLRGEERICDTILDEKEEKEGTHETRRRRRSIATNGKKGEECERH